MTKLTHTNLKCTIILRIGSINASLHTSVIEKLVITARYAFIYTRPSAIKTIAVTIGTCIRRG